MRFVHKISKGSRFNQIYIPKEMINYFEAGDLVEVKLLKKRVELFYLKSLGKLTNFKEKLIREIFNFLLDYSEIKQIFIFGSFLTKNFEYNDIDILILVEKIDKRFEKKIYEELIEELNLKFHVLVMQEDKIQELLKICPLTRSMLFYFISNKKFELPKKTRIDEKHIKFLLMIADDILKVDLEEGIEYYNVLRKLAVIEGFLEKKEIPPDKIDFELEKTLEKRKLELLKRNTMMDKYFLNDIKKIIKVKLDSIYDKLKGRDNGKKK